ncbi:MAG: hypothetical protein JW874_06550 [Spirochaetales bacterium]|nr:hypothetical protein [Spirochaetales bacterium]
MIYYYRKFLSRSLKTDPGKRLSVFFSIIPGTILYIQLAANVGFLVWQTLEGNYKNVSGFYPVTAFHLYLLAACISFYFSLCNHNKIFLQGPFFLSVSQSSLHLFLLQNFSLLLSPLSLLYFLFYLPLPVLMLSGPFRFFELFPATLNYLCVISLSSLAGSFLGQRPAAKSVAIALFLCFSGFLLYTNPLYSITPDGPVIDTMYAKLPLHILANVLPFRPPQPFLLSQIPLLQILLPFACLSAGLYLQYLFHKNNAIKTSETSAVKKKTRPHFSFLLSLALVSLYLYLSFRENSYTAVSLYIVICLVLLINAGSVFCLFEAENRALLRIAHSKAVLGKFILKKHLRFLLTTSPALLLPIILLTIMPFPAVFILIQILWLIMLFFTAGLVLSGLSPVRNSYSIVALFLCMLPLLISGPDIQKNIWLPVIFLPVLVCLYTFIILRYDRYGHSELVLRLLQ